MNTIKEIMEMKDGDPVEVVCMIVNKQRLPKKGSGDYILLKLQDSTGQIDMPVWDNIDKCDEAIKIKDKVKVEGKKSSWDKISQIKDGVMFPTEIELSDEYFIPHYNIPESMFKYFHDFVSKIKDERYHKLIAELIGITMSEDMFIKVIDSVKWTKYCMAPAAVNHHGNKLRGNFAHTVGVARAVDNMIRDYVEDPFFLKAEADKLNTDRLRFCALMHDWGKVHEYKWEDMTIEYNKEATVGHDILFIDAVAKANLISGSPFSIRELSDMYLIILTHHGQWSKYQPGKKDEVLLECTLLHQADMIDSNIVGAIEGSKY